MTVAQGYVLGVLALAALLAFAGWRQAVHGDVADGTFGGGVAVGLICLALIVEPPL